MTEGNPFFKWWSNVKNISIDLSIHQFYRFPCNQGHWRQLGVGILEFANLLHDDKER